MTDHSPITKSRLQTVLTGTEKDRFLASGTFVRLSIKVNEQDMLEPEFGVVLRCSKNLGTGRHECLVAFFGDDLAKRHTGEEPYLATFCSTSLAAAVDA